MKLTKLSTVILSLFIVSGLSAQKLTKFDPAKEPATGMQYYTPAQTGYYCGDPMPFSHNGTFYVYWLLDEHDTTDPLGGHKWTTSTTKDLINWQHHPLALPLVAPERSMCTGSTFYHNGTYYAFYATRLADEELYLREVISLATSKDGISFEKQKPMTLLEAPEGYALTSLRDPFIFQEKGRFYMIVTALAKAEAFDHANPCLIYYESGNLKDWNFKGRYYTPGSAEGFAHSECADMFKMGDYYYLLFKIAGGTYYRISESPFGPWRATPNDNIGNDYALVFKTADFNGRRIAVGFIPWREGSKDNGTWQYGGSLIFRELKQQSDGSLTAGYVPEMMPAFEQSLSLSPVTTWGKAEVKGDDAISLVSDGGFSAIRLGDLPQNAYVSFDVIPDGYYTEAGVLLRDEAEKRNYYEVGFIPKSNRVTLGNTFISDCTGLDKPFKVEIVMKESVIEVCINGKRCIVNRVFDYKGKYLSFYIRDGKMRIENLKSYRLGM